MRAKSRISEIALLGLGFMLAGQGVAQTYPAKPVQIVVPFPPGGSTDVAFRVLAPNMSAALGQQVLVVNRPGGAATIGMNVVAKSAPDGYTLGVANMSFAANPPFMAGKMPFDTEKDLVPVSLVVRVPLVLSVNPSVPARSMKELIALAKARPGELNYGSSGVASSGHLATALLESMSGTRMTHVPYVNSLPIQALISNQTQVQIGPIPVAMPHLKSGKAIALGVTTLQPYAALPGVPSIAESAVPGFEAYDWAGLVAPTGTPDAVINRIHQEVRKSLADQEIAKRIDGLGMQVAGSTPQEFGAHIKKEIATWAKVGAQILAAEATRR